MDSFREASLRPKLDMGYAEDQIKSEKKQSSNFHVQTSLKQEILQLEKRLKDQVAVRHSLERALGYNSSSSDFTNDDVSLPKPATELINEISVLELEVVNLEQYLLSLYRKTFDQQVTTLSPPSKDEKSKSPLTTPRARRLQFSKSDITVTTPRARRLQFSKSDITQRREILTVQATIPSFSNPYHEPHNIRDNEMMADSVVQRCHSNISQYSVSADKPPQVESLGKALKAFQSQPLSMMEYAQNTSPIVTSLADHLGTRISDFVPETANKISEAMIRCMSSIYYKLIDPSKENHALSSPISSLSSMYAFSKDQGDMYSSNFDVRLYNSFHADGQKEFSEPYSTMFEVPCVFRDNQNSGDVEDMLMKFRSLTGRLELVDPRKMTHEEKLAFWINIHNALVMHAFLAYGIPQNNMKRVYLLSKATYNVGGLTVRADMIQDSILGCRMSRPGQWLRSLLSPKSKFKRINEWQAYSIDHPEPLLHFALCSGSHSDPAVRVYTPKSVFEELERAKEEYICATFSVRKDKKLLLPKIVESFAKESGLCPNGLTEMFQQCLPEYLRKSLKSYQPEKPEKSFVWIPYNFSFRYLISKELVK